MQEYDIINYMVKVLDKRGHKYIMPNFTFAHYCPTFIGSFEADIYSINSSGYSNEYEIKTSLSDFKADQKKCGILGGFNKEKTTIYKSELIQKGERASKFWYVVPENLVPLDLVPTYAGLLYIRETDGVKSLLEIKKAPRLNNIKNDRKIIEQIKEVGYKRYAYNIIYRN
jgi:hypothetical protein